MAQLIAECVKSNTEVVDSVVKRGFPVGPWNLVKNMGAKELEALVPVVGGSCWSHELVLFVPPVHGVLQRLEQLGRPSVLDQRSAGVLELARLAVALRL
jgi:hypothetical protein